MKEESLFGFPVVVRDDMPPGEVFFGDYSAYLEPIAVTVSEGNSFRHFNVDSIDGSAFPCTTERPEETDQPMRCNCGRYMLRWRKRA